MEKATWCFYACNLDVEVKKAEETLRGKVDAEEQKLKGALAHFAHDATERVKLHLTTLP